MSSWVMRGACTCDERAPKGLTKVTIEMMMSSNCARRATLLSLTAASALLMQVPAQAAEQQPGGWDLLNMTKGVTAMSREIYGLHMLIFWVCVIIGAVVFGAMFWSLIAYRKSQGAVADTTMVHNTKVEIVWTVIPVAILIAMAVPAANRLVEIEDTRNTELTIKVTGYQWGWQYDYLDNGVVFFSRLTRDADAARRLASGADVTKIANYLRDVDNPLVVPVDTKVRLLVTATDVIHA